MLGLLVGSFLNVVIYRVPIMLNREWRAQCAELAAEDAMIASAGMPAATQDDTAGAEPEAITGLPDAQASEATPQDVVSQGAAAEDTRAREAPVPANESEAARSGAEPFAQQSDVALGRADEANPQSTYVPADPAAAPASEPGAAATAPETAAPPITPEPEKFNLVVPRSACPACGRQIMAIENVPVLSWLFLRGRCAGCGVAISWRYPAVELLTGVMSAAVAWKLGLGWPVVGGLVFTWFLIALTFIDIDTQLLPDNMTLPLMWLGLFGSLVLPYLGAHPTPGAPLPPSLQDSVIGAIAGYLSLWLVYHAFRLATGKEGMGYGDFKLLAAIGAWLGWQMLLPTILISATLGAVVGIALLSIRKKDRSVPIAFGPFLAIAGWIMLMYGREIVSRYLGLFPST